MFDLFVLKRIPLCAFLEEERTTVHLSIHHMLALRGSEPLLEGCFPTSWGTCRFNPILKGLPRPHPATSPHQRHAMFRHLFSHSLFSGFWLDESDLRSRDGPPGAWIVAWSDCIRDVGLRKTIRCRFTGSSCHLLRREIRGLAFGYLDKTALGKIWNPVRVC